MQRTSAQIIKALPLGILGFASMALYWYLFIALKGEPMSYEEVVSSYNYQAPQNIDFSLTPLGNRQFSFSFSSFDGDRVNGQIRYPQTEKPSYPVLLGVSAMGRSHERWWGDSYKGRPTITQVNKITDIANSKGYAVIAIDARYHGIRKDPERPLSSIMKKLHFFGDKTAYENMIRKTVLDYRVLIDWISTQPQLDKTNINLAGYSMGAQIVLLLSALEENIQKSNQYGATLSR
ncbi:alpha/beta fold hydrolase [uncultured Microbulbifer sp.]|nr:alpha/beta fold hydrolase [uncultured Microbulbifer sp.]